MTANQQGIRLLIHTHPDQDKLRAGNRVQGPALLIQLDITIVVPPGWGGAVDPYGNLLLEPG